MPASKIVNEQEVLQWFKDGITYTEMSRRYLEKYNIEMSPTAWGNFRKRKGLARRQPMNVDLIPWRVKPEHVPAYPLAMLRVESRLREGFPLRPLDAQRLASWKKMLEEDNVVVRYDPDTPAGFFYSKRQPGDTDLIRRPAVVTRERGVHQEV